LDLPKEYDPLFVFPSAEKLKSKILIDELFKKGSSFFIYPFKCWHYPSGQPDANPLLLVGAQKKSFKKAVDRNYIKRCMREAYRLHHRRQALSYAKGYAMAIVYVGKEKMSYKDIEKKLNVVFNRYIEALNRAEKSSI
jgi:ribonuclease P protein component